MFPAVMQVAVQARPTPANNAALAVLEHDRKHARIGTMASVRATVSFKQVGHCDFRSQLPAGRAANDAPWRSFAQ